jgi:hypothetical protein
VAGTAQCVDGRVSLTLEPRGRFDVGSVRVVAEGSSGVINVTERRVTPVADIGDTDGSSPGDGLITVGVEGDLGGETFTVPTVDCSVLSLLPGRVLESRVGAGLVTVDGLFQGVGRRPAGSTLELTIAGRAGVPGDAVAAMLNVAAVAPTGGGFLTVFPCGSPMPVAANVNYRPGAVVSNAVLAKIGAGGRVCVFSSAETDIVIDINGYVPYTIRPPEWPKCGIAPGLDVLTFLAPTASVGEVHIGTCGSIGDGVGLFVVADDASSADALCKSAYASQSAGVGSQWSTLSLTPLPSNLWYCDDGGGV